MSDTEIGPDGAPRGQSDCAGGVSVEIITARDVPLGGPRAMNVRRTLPQRKRSTIGAWCFADHYGPDDVAATGGMDVAPHPHTGLQTASWLFAGTIAHRDSGGVVADVLPGEINLMTSGAGICHSETSTADTTILHGVQLWIALPSESRNSPRGFENHRPPETLFDGGSALVFIGSLLGSTSPVTTHTPLLGAELRLHPHSCITLDVDPDFEHGLLVDTGAAVSLEGVPVPKDAIGYTGIGARTLRVTNDGDAAARLVLLGGTPFAEELVMFWNFLGRSSEEIQRFRDEWQAGGDRFGRVDGYIGHGGPNRNAADMSWLPAPTLPATPLRPRRTTPPHASPS